MKIILILLGLMQVFTCALYAGTYYVDKEGARPDRDFDSGPAIWKAIEKAAKSRNSKVIFSPGVYKVTPQGRKNRAAFEIFNADGLLLQGAKPRKVRIKGKKVLVGTTLLVMTPDMGALHFSMCKNVMVRNITIDYETLPYTQGRISAVDREGGAITLDIDEGYSLLSEPYFTKASHRWGMIMDKELPRPKAVEADHLFAERFIPNQGRSFTIKLAGNSAWRARYAEPGDRYVQLARTGTVALSFHKTKKLLVENVTIYASPAITSACQFCEDITYRNYSVRLKPDTDRILASNGDGIHFVNNRSGPTVTDCYFEGIADDGININGHGYKIKQVISPVKIVTFIEPAPQKGDVFQVVDPATGGIRGHLTVKSTTPNHKAKSREIIFVKPLKGFAKSDHIFNLNGAGEGYTIKDNTFRMHRRHGLLIRAGNGLIEGNTMEYLGSLGIDITNEMAIPEGPCARKVIIRNNTIKSVGYGPNYGSGAIRVSAEKRGYKPADARALSDITIEANTIINPPQYGICIASAQNIRLRNNVIKSEPGPMADRAEYGLLITNAAGIRVENQTVALKGAKLKAAVKIGHLVEAGEAGIEFKGLQVDLRPLCIKIVDTRQ